MKSLVDHLSQYAAYHRDPQNIATHFVGIPLIVIAVATLLSRPQWMGISPAILVMLASAGFYLRLELRLGLLMTVLLALSVWLGHTLAGLSTIAWLAWGIGLFVEWQSEEFQKRAEITTNFSSNVSQVNIPAELATGLFRIYQECLTNILRHAEATEVNSHLHLKSNKIELIIKDNGKGFIMENIEGKKTLGLLGMKERITLLGGLYQINSKPGEGTTILINLPLTE